MRRPVDPATDVCAPLAAFEGLWRHLFRSPIHLDSALAKLPSAERGAVAGAVSLVLRAPIATARALEIALTPGAPWSLDREALATWGDLGPLARAVLTSDLAALEARIEASASDFPPAMVDAWRDTFGADVATELAQVLSRRPPFALRASTRLGAAGLVAALPPELGAAPSATSPLGVILPRHAPITRLGLFDEGAFEIQDEGSQLLAIFALYPELVAPLLGARPGPVRADVPITVPRPKREAPVVVDACAGAGGKTLAIADLLGGRGRVFAYDVSSRKLEALKARASRAGLHSVKTTAVEDGRERALAETFRAKADVVLVDAPCSGWGVLRRNPDAKWRQDAAALARFPELQARLLASYAELARPGGRVVYGVCTFRPEETTAVVERVLAEAPRLARGPGGYLGPGPTDGFFVQAFDVS